MEAEMKITKREGKCDEDTFWECVAEIGWPVEDNDICKAKLLRAWTMEFGTEFRKIFDEKYNAVYAEVEAYEKNVGQGKRGYYLSDDGLSDFCAHIVGLGRKVYDEEMEDKSKMLARAVASDYEESFSYCFPHTPNSSATFEEHCVTWSYELDQAKWSPLYEGETFEIHVLNIRENWNAATKGDWYEIDPEHYANWAKKYLPGISEFLEALPRGGSADVLEGRARATILKIYLEGLVDGNTDGALNFSEKALESWWHLYHLAEDVGCFRSAHAAMLPMTDNARHGGENLINDHRRLMGQMEGFSCMFHYKQIEEKEAPAVADDWITTEAFDKKLEDICIEITAIGLLQIPGVYDAVREELNNDVIKQLEDDRPEAESG